MGNDLALNKDIQDSLLFYIDHPVEWMEDHTGIHPDDWQIAVANALVRRKFVAVRSGHGVGKAMCNDSIIFTPSGPKRWGDIVVGDEVFGATGNKTVVRATQSYTNIPMYRVIFDDGSFCDVSSGHLWNVRGRNERRTKITEWRTFETIDIINYGVKRPNGASQARQWEIPKQAPAQFDAQPLPLHPYFVGIWLGDGMHSQPAWGKPYIEIVEKVKSLGYDVSSSPDGMRHRLLGVTHLFTDPVFSLKSSDRYIPKEYLYNSVENRMALFQGLCDSDGETLHTGSIGYSTTSEWLAHDIIWLARSLGCKAMMQPTPKDAFYVKDGERVYCKSCYRVTINAPFNPFTLRHRKDKYKPSEARYMTRWIDSIEPIGNADAMCIEVEASDGLYLANDFIVTHNSCISANLILWFLCTHPFSKVICTSPTKEQLFDVLWAECAKWIRESQKLELILEWRKDTIVMRAHPGEWFAIARTAEVKKLGKGGLSVAEGLQGRHAESILYILDEASGIDETIMHTIDGALTSENSYVLMIGNPTRTSGTFFDAFHKNRSMWETFQVSCEKSPRVARDWIARMLAKYGSRDSPLYRIKVLGEFPLGQSNAVFSLFEVERAMGINESSICDVPRPDQFSTFRLGVDVARYGDNKTAIAIRHGNYLIGLESYPRTSTMEVAGKVVQFIRKYNPISVNIDVSGVGGGVYDRLREQGFRQVIAIDNGSKAHDPETYVNTRAESYWNLRQQLETNSIGFIRNDELIEELCSPTYSIDSRGKIKIESKEDMRRRGVASPDLADAVVLAFYEPPKKVRKTQFGFMPIMGR